MLTTKFKVKLLIVLFKPKEQDSTCSINILEKINLFRFMFLHIIARTAKQNLKLLHVQSILRHFSNDSKSDMNGKNIIQSQLSEELKFSTEKDTVVVPDYTNNITQMKFNSSTSSELSQSSQSLSGYYESEHGISINQKSELQLKDNPLALKTLIEGKIDLRDQRITVTHLNTADSALMGNSQGIHQISLGQVDVLPSNSILLEDIDVNNIPEDKRIIIDKNTKILYAIGKKIKKRQRTSFMEEGDTQSESSDKQSESSDKSSNKYELSIKKTIFEELSLEEYKDKYLWNFEKEFVAFDFGMLLRSLISAIPILILSNVFFDSLLELYKCKRDVSLMEDQLLNPFLNIRRQLQPDILLNDPRFDRKIIFPNQYKQLST